MTESSIQNNDNEEELYIILKYGIQKHDPGTSFSSTLISWYEIPPDFFAFLGMAYYDDGKYWVHDHFRNRATDHTNTVYRELIRNLVVYDRLFLQQR